MNGVSGIEIFGAVAFGFLIGCGIGFLFIRVLAAILK